MVKCKQCEGATKPTSMVLCPVCGPELAQRCLDCGDPITRCGCGAPLSDLWWCERCELLSYEVDLALESAPHVN